MARLAGAPGARAANVRSVPGPAPLRAGAEQALVALAHVDTGAEGDSEPRLRRGGRRQRERGGEDGHELKQHGDVSFHGWPGRGKTRSQQAGTLISTAPGFAGAGPSTSNTAS